MCSHWTKLEQVKHANRGRSSTLNSRIIACFFLVAMLSACSKDSEPAADGERAATAPSAQAGERVVAGSASASAECAQGGAVCPDGLECLTGQDGQQACGPLAVQASVLIKDTTMGGSCVFANTADTLPGASLASVQIIAVDGNVKGHGRLVWDEAGFEVAAERGTPPDGAAFTGDACTDFYNLGCDGQAVFEIVADGGGVQKIREGEMVIVHLRGQQDCGEEIADEVGAAICNDPAAAAAGNLESCTFRVRMIQARSDLYGPDRVSGTIQYLSGQ